MPLKRVLIAQQSTISHYRIPFYNALDLLRPKDWSFEVVYDSSEREKKTFFGDDVDSSIFNFPTLRANTYSLASRTRTISYQTFLLKARKFDLIIVEDAINNLTYPLCHLYKLNGTRIAYWGLGKDRKIDKHSPLTYLIEKFKLLLNRFADGYFAYTSGVKSYLVERGIQENRIFTVNNTLDINRHHEAFMKIKGDRDEIRSEFGLSKKKVLLFVSTFKKSKRADFLLNAFSILQRMDSNFHLLLVGSGGEKYIEDDIRNVSYFGSITDEKKLAPIFVASDIFAYPGQVGLAPLQALCYNLPVMAIESHYYHGPEIEYLSDRNSIVLPEGTSPEQYAMAITDLMKGQNKFVNLKSGVWPSIQHLTIENMANNFITGINSILRI